MTGEAAFTGLAGAAGFSGLRAAGLAGAFVAIGLAWLADFLAGLAAGLAGAFFPAFFEATGAALRAGFADGFAALSGLRAFAGAGFFAGLAFAPADFFFAADAGLRFWIAIFLTIASRRSRVIAQLTPSSNHLKSAGMSTLIEFAAQAGRPRLRIHSAATTAMWLCPRHTCATRIMYTD